MRRHIERKGPYIKKAAHTSGIEQLEATFDNLAAFKKAAHTSGIEQLEATFDNLAAFKNAAHTSGIESY